MKIKKIAVIIQNNIQFNSFENALKIMNDRNIYIDIYIPDYKSDDGFPDMFNEFYENIIDLGYNIYRNVTDTYYDILFCPYEVVQFKNIKRKYTIKYMYAVSAKPNYSMSLKINYCFDAFLCYGEEDAKILNNYGKTFKVGNLKYLNTKINKMKNDKKTILYLPTYSTNSSIEILVKELIKLKHKYNIIIKPHHGTEFLNNDLEKNRRELIKKNFENIYSSKTKLEELLNMADVVISDMSGAVFDAVSLNIPIVMYYNSNTCKYGEYESNCTKYAKNGHIVAFETLNNNLEDLIKKAMSKQQMEKEKELFNILFECDNKDSDKLFINFLNKLENNTIDEEYLKVHKKIKDEINTLINDSLLKEKIQAELNCEKNMNQELNDLLRDNNKNLEQMQTKIKELTTENENLKNNINSIYNSKSWKLIAPLIKIKKIISKKN